MVVQRAHPLLVVGDLMGSAVAGRGRRVAGKAMVGEGIIVGKSGKVLEYVTSENRNGRAMAVVE